ncbi:SacI homology domain-containing protein [Zopfochytrium polystomum]|nr:SacI homology domain-containing protein [Zopfochytrium polystomum]
MKTTFRVFRLHDGRVVVESPLRSDGSVKKSGESSPAEPVLVLTSAEGSSSVSVQDRKDALPATNEIAESIEVFIVIGVVQLTFGRHLLVATQRTLAATIQQHKIWRIAGAKAIPIGTSPFEKGKQQTVDDEAYAKHTLDQELLHTVEEIVNSGHLYFSKTYDLTHSLQHSYLLANDKATKTVLDERYFFNRYVQSSLIEHAPASPWVSRIICGFAGSIDIPIPEGVDGAGKTFTVTLVSRLNHRRLGTRYVRRGLDNEGNAANNVEMEQILFNHDFEQDRRISSFVQIRGSAPAIWGQELNLDYRPELLIVDINKPEVWHSIQTHYQDLKSQYIGEPTFDNDSDHGKVVCVNLLDDKGFEGSLTQTYSTTVSRFGDAKITYEEFPVNKWCKKMNFRNMDILLNRVRDRLINSQFFTAEGEVPSLTNPGHFKSISTANMNVSHWQTGLARVSCLDSLDRTNLTCSIFARYMIPFQLDSLLNPAAAGSFKPVDSVAATDVHDPVAALRAALSERSVRTLTNLWADSGDAISLLYAGTRALKSDVTRTGKRQWLKGSIDDGLNSLTRYYLNNFSDGRRQDGYDLWSGKVSSHEMAAAAHDNDEVRKRAKQLSKPILQRGKGITGWLLPGFVIDRVEPLLQAASEFASSTLQDQAQKAQRLQEAAGKQLSSSSSVPVEVAGNKEKQVQGPSYVGFLVSAIKIYAPERVTNVVEFLVAMVVFFYILVIVKIFQLKGESYVGRPKLTYEHKTIHEQLD